MNAGENGNVTTRVLAGFLSVYGQSSRHGCDEKVADHPELSKIELNDFLCLSANDSWEATPFRDVRVLFPKNTSRQLATPSIRRSQPNSAAADPVLDPPDLPTAL